MATGIASKRMHTEITVCTNCYHKDVCGDKDYITKNVCCNHKEAGRLIELPCNVGDIVYTECPLEGNSIVGFEVNSVHMMQGCNQYELLYSKNGELIDDIECEDDSFGKTVFLTKKAAEAAMEDKQNGRL